MEEILWSVMEIVKLHPDKNDVGARTSDQNKRNADT